MELNCERNMLINFICCLAIPIIQGMIISCCPISEDKVVDLSYPLEQSTIYWPGQKSFEMNVISNGTNDDGIWIQIEDYLSGIHVGTHMDAPCHFAKGRWSVDQIPLSRLLGPVALVDISHRAREDPDALLLVRDLQSWELLTGRTLNGSILLVRTGWGKKWSDRAAFMGSTSDDPGQFHFPGVSHKAAEWLVKNRKIYGLGIDSPSLDNGQCKDYIAHRTLLGANIFGIENLANLEKLPTYGATIHLSPIKIKNASGAPVRAVAYLP